MYTNVTLRSAWELAEPPTSPVLTWAAYTAMMKPSRKNSVYDVTAASLPARPGSRQPSPTARQDGEMLLTFGHGTASAEQMTELLQGAGVAALVDVRTAPGSRRHPHVARAELERWLPEAGVSYRWEKRLGGFRRPAPDSPDVAWREDAFRGYAGHMRTADFLAAIDEVLAQADAQVTTVMCAESLWWRCHRRLLADFACAARAVPVRHLMHDGRLEEHRLSPGLRVREDGLLVYDAGQPPLL
jgi:hypothetical protein